MYNSRHPWPLQIARYNLNRPIAASLPSAKTPPCWSSCWHLCVWLETPQMGAPLSVSRHTLLCIESVQCCKVVSHLNFAALDFIGDLLVEAIQLPHASAPIADVSTPAHWPLTSASIAAFLLRRLSMVPVRCQTVLQPCTPRRYHSHALSREFTDDSERALAGMVRPERGVCRQHTPATCTPILSVHLLDTRVTAATHNGERTSRAVSGMWSTAQHEAPAHVRQPAPQATACHTQELHCNQLTAFVLAKHRR